MFWKMDIASKTMDFLAVGVFYVAGPQPHHFDIQ
jgi:hypothetical protein